jgi:hypothetical protein
VVNLLLADGVKVALDAVRARVGRLIVHVR